MRLCKGDGGWGVSDTQQAYWPLRRTDAFLLWISHGELKIPLQNNNA
jgi:hypothetical protein